MSAGTGTNGHAPQSPLVVENDWGRPGGTDARLDEAGLIAAAQQHLAIQAHRPLVVSVMGQTGVGKSSLVNSLFGTDLKTGDVRPTTVDAEPVTTTDDDGHSLVFWDLPGIGEGEQADAGYLDLYRDRLANSDVVLWAVHADTRAVLFDVLALRRLLSGLEPADQARLFSKVVFVLTKSDLATAEPWTLGWDTGAPKHRNAKFVPPGGGEVLARKAEYFADALLGPFRHLVKTQTYNDEGFSLDLPLFTHDERHVTYEGFLGRNALEGLVATYPRYCGLFNRLAQNCEVVPCSARYRFNLTKVMLLVLNRLGPLALGRFKHFLSIDTLDALDFDDARRFCNVVVLDTRRRKVLYDLTREAL